MGDTFLLNALLCLARRKMFWGWVWEKRNFYAIRNCWLTMDLLATWPGFVLAWF